MSKRGFSDIHRYVHFFPIQVRFYSQHVTNEKNVTWACIISRALTMIVPGIFQKDWYVQDKNSTGETSLEPFLKVIQAREDCVVFMRRPNDETSQGWRRFASSPHHSSPTKKTSRRVTFPKTNSEKRHWKWMVGRYVSFWDPASWQVRTVSIREGYPSFHNHGP